MSDPHPDLPGTAHLDALDGLDPAARQALEAAAFRKLIKHLQWRTDAQNIGLMNLSGFCRNCLGKWLQSSAIEQGVALTEADARHAVYGVPYKEWKAAHPTKATDDQ